MGVVSSFASFSFLFIALLLIAHDITLRLMKGFYLFYFNDLDSICDLYCLMWVILLIEKDWLLGPSLLNSTDLFTFSVARSSRAVR
jgi:hypothetical protein